MEKINQIKELLNARRAIEVKKILDELKKDLEKLDNLQKFFDNIKTLVRNQGKSSLMTVSGVEGVIYEYEK